eukprot:g14923.t1
MRFSLWERASSARRGLPCPPHLDPPPLQVQEGAWTDQLQWAGEQVGVKNSMFFEEGKAWGRSRRLISPNLNGLKVAAMLLAMAKPLSPTMSLRRRLSAWT